MMSRPRSSAPALVICWLWLGIVSPTAWADDVPSALANATAQYYNFLLAIAQGQGVESSQRLVVNSTIVPFDIAADTPYFNEELFRLNADRTFLAAVGSIIANTAVAQASRFSSQYSVVLNIAASQIDQNHPEIQNSINELESQLTTATNALVAKNKEFDDAWNSVAASRRLDASANDYYAQRVTFFAQARYADQIQRFTEDVDRIVSQINATRRRVYTPSEQAVLDNLSTLSKAYNIARPWNAQTERTYVPPLTDLVLANPQVLPPAIFDSSPLILPVGDLKVFLTADGARNFDTATASSSLDAGSSSWVASARGSFLGWSLGGGGSGASSFSRSVSKMSSLEVSFKNVSEYYADRSGWFNPGVLQDPTTLKTVASRPELKNLQFVTVSLILGRGLTLKLHFSDSVTASDWTQSSFNARGGASFLGFSFGGSGGRSTTRSIITTDASGTTVTFQDGDQVVRVLGARVEPFVAQQPDIPQRISDLAKGKPALESALEAFTKGQTSYLKLQKEKLDALKTIENKP